MRFGKIEENEEIIKFNLELQCVNCNKKVPMTIMDPFTATKNSPRPESTILVE